MELCGGIAAELSFTPQGDAAGPQVAAPRRLWMQLRGTWPVWPSEVGDTETLVPAHRFPVQWSKNPSRPPGRPGLQPTRGGGLWRARSSARPSPPGGNVPSATPPPPPSSAGAPSGLCLRRTTQGTRPAGPLAPTLGSRSEGLGPPHPDGHNIRRVARDSAAGPDPGYACTPGAPGTSEPPAPAGTMFHATMHGCAVPAQTCTGEPLARGRQRNQLSLPGPGQAAVDPGSHLWAAGEVSGIQHDRSGGALRQSGFGDALRPRTSGRE